MRSEEKSETRMDRPVHAGREEPNLRFDPPFYFY